MSTELFKPKKFRDKSLLVIGQANLIIEEYMGDGYDLTLRQLYYQFVARDLIPNSQSEYNKLGNVINDARLAGLVDWAAIKDRTRACYGNSHWRNPEEAILDAARQYAIDIREDQDVYMEVWVEKEALAGVIERVCSKIDVPWFACRGYVSQTAMYEASKRFLDAEGDAKDTIIFHLGDHDPSGMDMTRDIRDRLHLFGSSVDVVRIALNMDQVDEYEPPPNPAKLTDSRCDKYIAKYGDESWELDALDPHILSDLIERSVSGYTDPIRMEVAECRQLEQQESLINIAKRYDEIAKD